MLTFQIGDEIVYPMHGAGVVAGIEEKCILGKTQTYYILELSVGAIQVMLPEDQLADAGIRTVVSVAEADSIMREIKRSAPENADADWNTRYRNNLEHLKHGTLKEVAMVAKALWTRDKQKSLSNAERKIFQCAKKALISELMLSKGRTYEEMETLVLKAIS